MTSVALRIGVAEREITPSSPIPLAGFAVRQNRAHEGVDRKLWVRAWYFQVRGDAALLLVADVLWWAPERVHELRRAIAGRHGIERKNILLHATHTHSAPQTSHVHTASLGVPDQLWIDVFERTALETVAEAVTKAEEVHIQRFTGSSDIGYNRRARVDYPADEARNGAIDETLTVLKVTRAGGSPFGLLVHFACHPTVTAAPRVSSEFPGILCEQLREEFGTVSYLQGACGDINPAMTRGRPERDFGDRDVEAVATELAREVRRALQGIGEDIRVERLSNKNQQVMCRVKAVPTEDDLARALVAGGLRSEWARVLTHHPERRREKIPLELSAIRFGPQLGFLGISGEVSAAYGLTIAHATNRCVLPLAYTNGMTGYIITDAQLAAGGYESVEAPIYFGMPSPFRAGLEATVSAGIHAVLETESTR